MPFSCGVANCPLLMVCDAPSGAGRERRSRSRHIGAADETFASRCTMSSSRICCARSRSVNELTAGAMSKRIVACISVEPEPIGFCIIILAGGGVMMLTGT